MYTVFTLDWRLRYRDYTTHCRLIYAHRQITLYTVHIGMSLQSLNFVLQTEVVYTLHFTFQTEFTVSTLHSTLM